MADTQTAEAIHQIIMTAVQRIQQIKQIALDAIQQSTSQIPTTSVKKNPKRVKKNPKRVADDEQMDTSQIPTTSVKKNLKRVADDEQINRSHKMPRKTIDTIQESLFILSNYSVK